MLTQAKPDLKKVDLSLSHCWGTISTDVLEILPVELVGFKKEESTRGFASAAVVVADSILLNKSSSFFLLSFSFLVKAIKWLSTVLSVVLPS